MFLYLLNLTRSTSKKLHYTFVVNNYTFASSAFHYRDAIEVIDISLHLMTYVLKNVQKPVLCLKARFHGVYYKYELNEILGFILLNYTFNVQLHIE